jgi:glutamine synthetase
MRQIVEDDVEFIRLQFTDIFGKLRNVAVTRGQVEKVLSHRFTFDASAIPHFTDAKESDLCLYPDLSTFATFPWRPQQGKVARLICDIYQTDGQPFLGDSRLVLKNVLTKATAMGYDLYVGPECEFFLFNVDEVGAATTATSESGEYFDVGPMDAGENARREMVQTLEDMGFEVLESHHEAAPGQHEIVFAYAEAGKAADNIQTYKLAVRTIARRHGLHATFMPKPLQGVHGSGMHLNLSLHKSKKNVFVDKRDAGGLSKTAYAFIAGLLEHAGAISALSNPLVNSYKRLGAGYQAPNRIAWSFEDDSPLIRIPAGRGDNTRLELRSPDCSANPYLTIAMCLAAGLDGIERGLNPQPAYTATGDGRKMAEKLPASLNEALDYLESSTLARKCLGDYLLDKYIFAKREEWNDYATQVTDWEIDKYLNRI